MTPSEEKAVSIVVADLMKNGQDIVDIGIIVGCLGSNSKKWLQDLKDECTSIDEFLELASKRADIELISAMVKAALGYDYKEQDIVYENKREKDAEGQWVYKKVEGKRTVKHKHARKNDALLKFILKNRYPEYFHDAQKIEINKKSIEIKDITENEIRGFAGKLLETENEDK